MAKKATSNENQEIAEEKEFKPTDLEWTDYVLGKLDESEMVEGCPKTDGLRRLVELFIGEIIEVRTECIQPAMIENGNRATVVTKITIDKAGKLVSYQCVADSCSRNTDPPYNQYPPQVAETRALGRCYRLALRLKGVVAVEEKSDNAENVPDDIDDNLKISESQIIGINNLCKNLNINVANFINAGQIKYTYINDIPLSKGTKILKTLNEYRVGTRNVPESIQGYQSNWRDGFVKQEKE